MLVCLVALVAAAVDDQNSENDSPLLRNGRESTDIPTDGQVDDPNVDLHASEVTVKIRTDSQQRIRYGGYSGPYGGYGERGNFGGIRG